MCVLYQYTLHWYEYVMYTEVRVCVCTRWTPVRVHACTLASCWYASREVYLYHFLLTHSVTLSVFIWNLQSRLCIFLNRYRIHNNNDKGGALRTITPSVRFIRKNPLPALNKYLHVLLLDRLIMKVPYHNKCYDTCTYV